MFRFYHFNLRYSLEREKKISSEKDQAELQIKLEKEEQARLKSEQKLLSLQKQKLEDEMMVNHLHLQHKSKVLHQLKEKLDSDKSVNLKQIIKEEKMFDDDFEKTKFQITEVHPNFFNTLKEKSKQKLTSLDLQYCAYLYLDMDTKQIAKILHVEPKSVRMAKYRLKQKLGIDSEIDLTDYLKQL